LEQPPLTFIKVGVCLVRADAVKLIEGMAGDAGGFKCKVNGRTLLDIDGYKLAKMIGNVVYPPAAKKDDDEEAAGNTVPLPNPCLRPPVLAR
jgi:hypothetical protein